MPGWLIRQGQTRYDFTRWDDLYAPRDEAQVSFSNLVVRLQRLKLIYILEGSKAIWQRRSYWITQISTNSVTPTVRLSKTVNNLKMIVCYARSPRSRRLVTEKRSSMYRARAPARIDSA